MLESRNEPVSVSNLSSESSDSKLQPRIPLSHVKANGAIAVSFGIAIVSIGKEFVTFDAGGVVFTARAGDIVDVRLPLTVEGYTEYKR